MKILSKALSATAVVACAAIGVAALTESAVVAKDAEPRTNTAKPGEVWTSQPQGRVVSQSAIVPETRSTALRTAMQNLSLPEQRTFAAALNKLTPEERRVLAKALSSGPSLSSSSDLTPPTPPVPPTSPLNPATSSRTGQGSSGSGTLAP